MTDGYGTAKRPVSAVLAGPDVAAETTQAEGNRPREPSTLTKESDPEMTTIALAALISWIITAGGGIYMLAIWLAKGGVRRQPRATHLPPGLLFAHFLLAVAGLVIWMIYLSAPRPAFAWTALVILAVAAAGGFAMLARWISIYRTPYAGVVAPTAGGGTTEAETTRAQAPPERHFSRLVVAAHGFFAATTLVLVLLTALRVGTP